MGISKEFRNEVIANVEIMARDAKAIKRGGALARETSIKLEHVSFVMQHETKRCVSSSLSCLHFAIEYLHELDGKGLEVSELLSNVEKLFDDPRWIHGG